MSLPLLISLFLAALVGVFPATAPALAAPAAMTPAAVTPAAVVTPAVTPAAVVTPAGTYAVERHGSADASPVERGVAPAVPAPPTGTEPTIVGHPDVRVLTALDVHAAAAPRAPPLHLV